MHQALFIQEILLNIFGHCYSPTERWYEYNADLAVLARTCQAFKEPALDLLWVELQGFAPLARCLPGACYASNKYYSLSRELSESEWGILRGYTRRVRHICGFSSLNGYLDPTAMRVIFTLAPFTDPLFPNLQSLSWEDFQILPIVHAIVPSLISLSLDFRSFRKWEPSLMDFLDAVGEHCRHMKDFHVRWSPTGPFDVAISRQVCRWSNLQYLDCFCVTLSTDAILHLACLSTLKSLSFTLSIDSSNHIPDHGSILVFHSLSSLQIASASLKSVTRLLSYIRIPRIASLGVNFSYDAWKQDVQAYWATVEQACYSSPLRWITLVCYSDAIQDPDDLAEQMHLHLTLEDLPFYKVFHDLEGISIDLPWSVNLTNADILDLVSDSPDLFELSINADWGWNPEGTSSGITLDGVMELLRICPSLEGMKLAIDTQTFTDIPEGLDIGFRPEMVVDFLDSHISPELVPELASVFTALNLNSFSFNGGVYETRDPAGLQLVRSLWNSVWQAMP